MQNLKEIFWNNCNGLNAVIRKAVPWGAVNGALVLAAALRRRGLDSKTIIASWCSFNRSATLSPSEPISGAFVLFPVRLSALTSATLSSGHNDPVATLIRIIDHLRTARLVAVLDFVHSSSYDYPLTKITH